MQKDQPLKCVIKKSKSYSYDNEKFCPTERFLNFIEFYKSYGELDGHKAFMEAKRDKDRETKYGLYSTHSNFQHYIDTAHKRLIYSLKETAIKGY